MVPYLTERMLQQSPTLAPLRTLAALSASGSPTRPRGRKSAGLD